MDTPSASFLSAMMDDDQRAEATANMMRAKAKMKLGAQPGD